MTSPASFVRRAISEVRTMSGRSLRPLVWSFVLTATTQAVIFACNLGLARLLGKTPFGEWAAIQNTLITISGIAQLSMAITATRYTAHARDTDREQVGGILGLCSAVTAITATAAGLGVLAGAPVIAGGVLAAPHLTTAVRLSALSLCALTLTGYQIGALAGLERFKLLAVLSLVTGVLTVAGVLVLAHFHGVTGAVLGYAIGQGCGWLFHHLALRAECRREGIQIRWRGAARYLEVLGGFAFPATLAGIAGMLGIWLCTVALVRSGGSFGEMAIFAAASNLRAIVLFAPSVVSRVTTSVLTNLSGQGERKQYSRSFLVSVVITFASALLVAVPLAILARPLLSFFGRDFREGQGVVLLLLCAGVLEAATTALGQHFVALGRMWANFAVFLIRGATLAGAAIALAPSYGAAGAGIASVAAHALALVLALVFVLREADPVPIAGREAT